MIRLKKLSVILLLVCSIFMTGCDATQIVEVIGKIAQGVQQAMPAIKNVVDTFTNAFGNNNDNANANNQQPAAQQPAETNKVEEANVAVVDPNKEDVGTGAAANPEQAGNNAVPYDEAGTESTLAAAAEIKAKYGVTLLNGKKWTSEWEVAAPGTWTSKQAADLAALLAKIPARFRTCTTGIAMQQSLKDKEDGHEFSGLGGDPILISSNSIGADGFISLEELAVHEMTHRFQDKYPDVERLWNDKFWPNGKQTRASITDYGNTNAAEDMAECVATFFVNPEKLKQQDPERYEFVKNNIWK